MKRYNSLQALRGLAFLGIFFIHCEFVVNWAGLGVSVFFVLSGFLTERKYGDSFDKITFKQSYSFAKTRIKRIYPLHIILMLLWAGWQVIKKINTRLLLGTFAEVFLNVTLTQSWIPNSTINVCLNGVAWFLSTIAVHYLVFPLASNFIKKIDKLELVIILLMMLVAQVFSCWFLKVFCSISKEAYSWFMYTSPIFRFVDFFAGMSLSHCLPESEEEFKITVSGSIEEMAVFVFTIVLCWLFQCKKPDVPIVKSIFNGSTLYVIASVMLVKIFFEKKGIITKILSCKVLIFLGNLSPILFLIHFPVTQFRRYYLLLSDNVYTLTGIKLFVSIVLSIVCTKIEPITLTTLGRKKIK